MHVLEPSISSHFPLQLSEREAQAATAEGALRSKIVRLEAQVRDLLVLLAGDPHRFHIFAGDPHTLLKFAGDPHMFHNSAGDPHRSTFLLVTHTGSTFLLVTHTGSTIVLATHTDSTILLEMPCIRSWK